MILQPPSCLLAGPAGAGKTSALMTQLLCGIRVHVIVTEPGGAEVLLDAAERLRAPIDNLHWVQCTPNAAGWMELEDMITKISSMDQKQLSDQKDMGKAAFRPAAMKLLNALRNFTCDRTGKNFGDFTQWDDTCSLNMDSLTGLSMIAFGATVGYKPTPNQGEWGIAQNFAFALLTKINSDRQCFFNMTSHIEKENDDLTGVRRLMVSTIGAKLAPKIPPFFSEVIKCSRALGDRNVPSFTWSTIDVGMDLKNRALPIGVNLPANFAPVIEAYRRRKKLAGQESGSLQISAPQTLPYGASQLVGGPASPPPKPAAAIVPPAAPMSPSATKPGAK